MGETSRRSTDLAAPERGMIGGEVSVGRAKRALQLDDVALGKRRHGLQPERRRLGGVRSGNLAPRAPDSVAPFSTSRPRMRALVLELTL